MFIHHPDGYIIIDGERIDLAVFMRLEAGYQLPDGALGQIYEPRVKHSLIVPGGERPLVADWIEGDGYIRRVGVYRREMARRGRPAAHVNQVPIIRREVQKDGNRQQQSRLRSRIDGSGGRDADRAGEEPRPGRAVL